MAGTPFSHPLLFVDCEMTGLDPQRDRLMEFACVLTDGALRRREEGPSLVLHCPEEELERMNSWCKEHHGASGLTAACRASRVTAQDAERQVLGFLKQHGIKEKEACLAGNSIHVDRQFLLREMPALTDYLHYRIVDVSTVKILANSWYPEMKGFKKQNTHRALDDIKESIEELAFYREHIFKPKLT
ncbi:hypothetical protein Emed_006064 [Eimeria media]